MKLSKEDFFRLNTKYKHLTIFIAGELQAYTKNEFLKLNNKIISIADKNYQVTDKEVYFL